MKRIFILAVAAFSLLSFAPAFAQHGGAESGYYPPGYNGATFTGEVTAVNDSTREITLTYKNKKGDKSETFVGVLESGHTAKMSDGTSREIKASDFPIGTRLTVYYMEKDKKVDGKKTTIHSIFKFKVVPPAGK